MIKGELELHPDEVIYYYADAIRLDWDYEETESVEKGVGELFVTTEYELSRRVHFRTEANTEELAYKEIAMHGLSSDPANFGAPCVLLQPEDKDFKWLLKPQDSGLSKEPSSTGDI